MDLITQGILGAAVGQVVGGRTLGKRATRWGAVAGLLPDLDTLSRLAADPWAELVWHRGPTHSLWFGPLMGPLLGYACYRWAHRSYQRDPTPPDPLRPHPGDPAVWRTWAWVWLWAIFTHPLLDVFTTYGTQLLSPFEDTRFAIDAISITAPIYTVPLALSLVLGWIWRRSLTRPVRAAALALTLTTGYLGYCTWQNAVAEAQARESLKGTPLLRVEAYPTFFQPWLRRVVAWSPGGVVRTGDLTTLTDAPIHWQRFVEPDDPRVAILRRTPEGRLMDWFSMGNLFAVTDGDRVRLLDLRYGLPMVPGPGGIWGVEGEFDGDRLVGAPRRWQRGRRGADVGAIWRYLWARVAGGPPWQPPSP